MKATVPSIVILSFLLISAISSPLVLGQNVQLEETAELKADERYEYDKLLNHANETDGNYSNHEMLWKPFKQRFNKKGVVSATPTPPHLVNLENIDYGINETYIHIGTTIRFTYQQIMSGSSEHYWRSPFSFKDGDYNMRMRVFRVDSPTTAGFSVDQDNPDQIVPNPLGNPIKVFDSTEMDIIEGDNRTVNYIKHSVELPSEVTDKSTKYNFTYIKGNFPIYPNEDYYTVFSYKGEQKPDLFISRDDIGGNGVFETDVSYADTDGVSEHTYNADFEVSTMFLSGMSGAMSGINGNGDYLTPEIEESSIQWKRKFQGSDMSSGDYLTLNIPFRYTEGGAVNISVSVNLYNNNNSLLGSFTWLQKTASRYILFDTNYSMLDSIVGSDSVSDINNINFTLKINSGNPDNLDFWVYDYNNNFTKSYEYSNMVIETKQKGFQPFGYQIYHSLQITNGSWELINPISFYEVTEERVENNNGINWISLVEHSILTSTGLGFVSSYVIKNYGDTPPHEILWNWAKEKTRMIIDRGMEIGESIGETLQSWGMTLWKVVKKTAKAIQYYGAGLLNLIIMGFSIASYILYSVVILKVVLGLIVLVSQGSDAMLTYYSKMMDNIIGLTESAVGLLPMV